MVFIEKDVQKRILWAIFHNGGIARTNEIMELTGLRRRSVHAGVDNLKSRALVKKEKPILKPNRRGYDNSIVRLRTGNPIILQKIKRLISEIK